MIRHPRESPTCGRAGNRKVLDRQGVKPCDFQYFEICNKEAPSEAYRKFTGDYLDGVVRWRLCDLAQWLWEEFRISVSVQTLGREVRALGYRKLSARPRHYAQDANAAETFKKTSPPLWRKSPRVQPRVE